MIDDSSLQSVLPIVYNLLGTLRWYYICGGVFHPETTITHWGTFSLSSNKCPVGSVHWRLLFSIKLNGLKPFKIYLQGKEFSRLVPGFFLLKRNCSRTISTTILFKEVTKFLISHVRLSRYFVYIKYIAQLCPFDGMTQPSNSGITSHEEVFRKHCWCMMMIWDPVFHPLHTWSEMSRKLSLFWRTKSWWTNNIINTDKHVIFMIISIKVSLEHNRVWNPRLLCFGARNAF